MTAAFKQKIFQTFLQNLNEKIDTFQHTLNELRESVLNETKSTAGDKHETALAMLQMEQSQIAKHMQDAVSARKSFMQIDLWQQDEIIKAGSLIKTDRGYFLLGVALPKIIVDGHTILAISIASPLGQMLLGKKAGNEIVLNQIKHTIEALC
jgi:hypothetical protein